MPKKSDIPPPTKIVIKPRIVQVIDILKFLIESDDPDLMKSSLESIIEILEEESK